MSDDDDDGDPLAPAVAAAIVMAIVGFLVLFVLVTGGMLAPAKAWRIVATIGPWYLGLSATIVIARWLGRRKRR